jgi:4Fe-4S ferredoxin
MPFKKVKRDTPEKLTLQWVLQTEDYKLDLDRRLCAGCQICSLACPKEAIKLEKTPKIEGEKAEKAKVDIDLDKCNFCAICDILCPYGAIKVTLKGEHVLSVVEKESFPQLIRDIQVDASKYSAESKECEDACPLGLITITKLAADDDLIENAEAPAKKNSVPTVEIDINKDNCPCCRICEFKCPEGVIRVRKFFHGKIKIDPEKCPEGCTDCLDVCPLTGALFLSDDYKKVLVNETFCIYCGACKVVCPVEEALEVKRTKVSHTPVKSGAWNKALERLASPVEISKELKAKGSLKAMDSVEKLLVPRRERNDSK